MWYTIHSLHCIHYHIGYNKLIELKTKVIKLRKNLSYYNAMKDQVPYIMKGDALLLSRPYQFMSKCHLVIYPVVLLLYLDTDRSSMCVIIENILLLSRM